MTTNVPKIEFTDTGLSIPQQAQVLRGVQAGINEAFGGNLSQNLETPQGQLASSMAAIVGDANNQLAQLSNNFDPQYSTGVWQDALAKIYFLTRKTATYSYAYCDILGMSGVTVPAGFWVKDESGYLWALESDTAIPVSGTVSALFTCTTSGAVVALSGAISSVYSALDGVDRVSNPNDAVVGKNTETREEFEFRRKNSVAKNSYGTTYAVYSEVFNLSGVSDVFVYDNKTGNEITYGATNYMMDAHSLYVAVVGGDDETIARAILLKAGNGASYMGNTSVLVYDETFENPKPEYTIKFQRPSVLQTYWDIRIEESADLPADFAVKIANAIVNAFSGVNRPRIGSHIHAMKFVPTIMEVVDGLHLISVQVGKSSLTLGASVVAGIDEVPAVSFANINVQVV